jgi:hypothetical protein
VNSFVFLSKPVRAKDKQTAQRRTLPRPNELFSARIATLFLLAQNIQVLYQDDSNNIPTRMAAATAASSAPYVPKYNEDLRAPLQTAVGDSPKVKVHRVEWAKVRQQGSGFAGLAAAGSWAQTLLHQRLVCCCRVSPGDPAVAPPCLHLLVCTHVCHTQVMAGDPVEINPSTGSGFRVMSVDEWAARFRWGFDFKPLLQHM